ncbi:MAG: outer membrane beta-barrel protein [Candidatus Delongbacteria bacterium]
MSARSLALLICAVCPHLPAAEAPASPAAEFTPHWGIGIDVKSFLDLGSPGGTSGGGLYLPFHLSPTAFVEPFVNYRRLRREYGGVHSAEWEEWEETRQLSLGVGLFVKQPQERINWLLGIRAGYSWYREESNYEYIPGVVKSTALSFSPTLGAEYRFDGGLSLGSEIRWQYDHYEGDGEDQSYEFQGLNPYIMLRYYLGK